MLKLLIGNKQLESAQVLVDAEDYEELLTFNWFISTDSTRRTAYAVRNLTRTHDNKVCGTEKMHRRLMGVTDPEIHIDHINGNGLDNRKQNLRIVTRSQNQLNRRINLNSQTGIKGVSRSKEVQRPIQAHLQGKRLYGGTDFFLACCARKAAELNIPKGTEK